MYCNAFAFAEKLHSLAIFFLYTCKACDRYSMRWKGKMKKANTNFLTGNANVLHCGIIFPSISLFFPITISP